MAKISCSLCGNMKEAAPLDMDDPLFSFYVRIARTIRLSKHEGPLGICASCMPRYRDMEKRYSQKKMFYLVLAACFGIAYYYFTKSVALSLLIALFLLSLSLFDYIPPLKAQEKRS